MNKVFITGYVLDTKDPEGLGRVQVHLRGFPDPIKTPWLRMLYTYATGDNGIVFLPEKEDEVIVAMPVVGDDIGPEHLSQMIILGVVFNGKKKPPYSNEDGNNEKKIIQTPKGNALIFEDVGGAEKVTLQAASESTSIILDNSTPSITIAAGQAKIVVADGGKDVKVQAGMTVQVEGVKVVIKGSGTVDIQGTGPVNVKSAAMVKVSGAMVELAGAQIKLSGMVAMG